MKQNRFLKKLLSLGLAAAVTIGSLVGSGSVMNPMEVKAAEAKEGGTITGATVTFNSSKPVSSNDLGSKVTKNDKPTKVDVTVTTGGSITSIPITINESFSGTGVITGSGLKVTFASSDSKNYTVTVENDELTAPSFSSSATVQYTVEDTGSTDKKQFGDVWFTGSMVVGKTITAKVDPLPEGVKVIYTFLEVNNNGDQPIEGKIFQTGESNTFYIGEECLGKKVGIKVQAEGYADKLYWMGYDKVSGKEFGKVTLSGDPVVGATITATIENLPKDVKVTYYFFEYGKDDGQGVIERREENTLVLSEKWIGKTIMVTANAYSDGYAQRASENRIGPVTNAPSIPSTPSNPGSSSTGTDSSIAGVDSSKTEISTGVDGTKTETVTKPDGSKVETVTRPNGSATVTTTETKKNASDKDVKIETIVEKDANGNIKSETRTSVIADADKDTNVTVVAATDNTGVKKCSADIEKTGTMTSSGATKGNIAGDVVKQIVAAAGTTNVAITQTVTSPDGKDFTVTVNASLLESGNTLKLMKIDPATGDLVLCNSKSYDVSGAGGVSLSIKSGGEYVLMSEEEANAQSDAIVKTIKLANTEKTVKPGKTTKVTLSSKVNKKNVSNITYKVNKKSVATVDKDGKVKAKKKGTVTVTAKITLKNGKTKTVKMKVTVK